MGLFRIVTQAKYRLVIAVADQNGVPRDLFQPLVPDRRAIHLGEDNLSAVQFFPNRTLPWIFTHCPELSSKHPRELPPHGQNGSSTDSLLYPLLLI